MPSKTSTAGCRAGPSALPRSVGYRQQCDRLRRRRRGSSIAVTADVSDVSTLRARSHRRRPKSWQRCKHTALSNQFRFTSKRTPRWSVRLVAAGSAARPALVPLLALGTAETVRRADPQQVAFPRLLRSAWSGNDKLYGFAGSDFLSGGSGRDLVDGGNGNDNLVGGSESDLIRGGLGERFHHRPRWRPRPRSVRPWQRHRLGRSARPRSSCEVVKEPLLPPTLTADLALALSPPPDPVALNTDLMYVATVTNAGPGTASTASLSFTLPSGATYVGASTATGSCQLLSPTVSCSLGAIASGTGTDCIARDSSSCRDYCRGRRQRKQHDAGRQPDQQRGNRDLECERSSATSASTATPYNLRRQLPDGLHPTSAARPGLRRHPAPQLHRATARPSRLRRQQRRNGLRVVSR